MRPKIKKLLKCVVLDVVGMTVSLIPVIGNLSDVVWAPIAAAISYKMFGDKKGKYASVITFVEEILPVTDFVPSFTIFFVLFDVIGIGKYQETKEEKTMLNVEYEEVKTN